MNSALKWSLCLLIFFLSVDMFSRCFDESQQVKDKQIIMENAPRVFIDCDYCDIDYIRTEIPFINYVWDRKNADIHLQITSQRTGSGGTKYTLDFYGQNHFQGTDDRLKCISLQTYSEDEERIELVKTIKIGLMRYISRTTLAKHISISFDQKTESAPVKDRWKSWIFKTSLRGSISGEKSYSSNYVSGSLSADRVTPHLKINLGVYSNFRKSGYDIDGETYSDKQERHSFYGLVVKSLGEHWSTGIISEVKSSTYNNIDFSTRNGPALEYNIFPYSQSTKRQLLLNYSIGYEYIKYREQTIYDKLKEHLLNHIINISYKQKTKWGSFYASLEGSQYFFDLSKNRLRMCTSLSIRILKGFSFDMWGSYSIIHDQLGIIKGDIAPEEILLRQRQLATTYDYYISLGFSYSFGSIYNNIVNPRFEGW